MNTVFRVLNTLLLVAILTTLLLILKRIPKEPVSVEIREPLEVQVMNDELSVSINR